jgi:hypothetical protein
MFIDTYLQHRSQTNGLLYNVSKHITISPPDQLPNAILTNFFRGQLRRGVMLAMENTMDLGYDVVGCGAIRTNFGT